MATKPKIIIGVPTQNTVMARTAFHLVQAAISTKCEVDMVLRMGCDLIGSRNGLVQVAKEKGATHILFVDDDMVFEREIINKLLSHDKEIIGVAYNFRSFPLKSTAIPEGVELKDGSYHQPPEAIPKEPFRCRSLGTGLLLIDLSVFDKIPQPWFEFIRNPDGSLVQGEDTFFCQRAQEAGYEIWCDPTIKVAHSGEYLF